MTKSDFEIVAGVLSSIGDCSTKIELVEKFSAEFAKINRRFNQVIFRMKCYGLKPNKLAKEMGK
jgi:hypothetical protein